MALVSRRVSRDSTDLDLHLVGVVEGDEVVSSVVFDPADFKDCNAAKITGMFHAIQSDLLALLYWEHEGEDLLIAPLEGRGVIDLGRFGGLENPAQPGWTGRIVLKVFAPKGGDATRHFAISLDLTKQRKER